MKLIACAFHLWLLEILAPVGSQEVTGNTYNLQLFIGHIFATPQLHSASAAGGPVNQEPIHPDLHTKSPGLSRW